MFYLTTIILLIINNVILLIIIEFEKKTIFNFGKYYVSIVLGFYRLVKTMLS